MDKVKAVKAQLRLQQWAERISECQASSMTVVAWCEAHDINVKTYYYWLYIPPTETHCHGKIEPPSRDLRATITEK